MFKQLRIKIIIVVISVFTILFASILISIYSASYHKSISDTNMMLRILSNKRGFIKLKSNSDSQKNSPYDYDSSKYYLVLIEKNDNVKRIANNSHSDLSNKELGSLSLSLIHQKQRYGTVNDLTYLITKRKNSIFVAFSNNRFQNSYLKQLFDNILLYGCVGLILLLLISVQLSKWLVKPLETVFQKQKQFISDASHELKTPIAIISSNTDALQREIGECKWLDYIHGETTRMGALVTDLLELAAIDSHNNKNQFKKLNFSDVAMSTVLPFESMAFEKEIYLNEQIDENIYIFGDSIRLSQLITILIDNAFHHTEKEGNINVQLKQLNGKRILTVSNTGDEIPLAEQELIFERFYRADKARTREKGNYGLGLAIAQSIVKSHNAKISVSCKNRWITFKIVF